MKRKVVKKNGRDKAFIGAIIGAVAGIAGNIIDGNKKRKAEELAFQQQQAAQTKADGYAQAQAMSAGLADQGYAKEYKKKVVLKGGGKVSSNKVSSAQKMSVGGRDKYQDGGVKKVNNTNNLVKQDYDKLVKRKDSLTNAKKDPRWYETSRDIQQKIDITDKYINSKSFDNVRKKFEEGGFMKSLIGTGGVGGAVSSSIGGLAGLAGSLFNKVSAPKMIQKSDGFSAEGTKKLTANDYQVDANGNPIVNPIVPNTIQPPNPQQYDRMELAKFGKRKRNTLK